MLTIYHSFGFYQTSGDKSLNTLLPSSDLSSVIALNKNSDLVEFKINQPSVISTIYKNSKKYQGKVKNITDKVVSFEDNNKNTINLRDYDYVETPQQEFAVLTQNKARLSYLINDISWEGKYNGVFSNDRLNLTLQALIDNKLDRELDLKNLSLVAGDVQKNVDNRMYMLKTMAPQAEALSDVQAIKPQDLNEYKLFEVGPTKLSKNNNILTLDQYIIDSDKYYYNELGSTQVKVGYQFNAPSFLSSGDVNLYEDSGDLSFVGSSSLRETQEDQLVTLMAGSTTRVKINTKISEKNLKNKTNVNLSNVANVANKKNVNINSVIDNLTDQPAVIKLSYYVGNAKVEDIKVNNQKNKSGEITYEDNKLIFNVDLDEGENEFNASLTLTY